MEMESGHYLTCVWSIPPHIWLLDKVEVKTFMLINKHALTNSLQCLYTHCNVASLKFLPLTS